ncbi:MAG: hypothetical protein PWR27_540 [Petroclostridium sp.]|jgi:uncharacterized membrane protein HdeD (DUF308 family)|uniref:hypothetical protein n=1 Tax=Petroclostridium xylanilyticum TaxID=1792311 RepID=UPI000B987AF2|nr:hypothetical protein [Petroclostridium xylanilyticum]MBZ4646954.1 hypothetical protein [Clostridia bacterium]MDK2809831.1 hypothetical protein [Petroclostridium sp.]
MEQNRQKGIVPGVILIGLGILFLLNNYNIDIGDWFVLGVGVAFIIAYFTKRKTGFLIAGLILSYLGSLIFLNNTRLIDEELFGSLVIIMLGLAFLTVYFVKKKTGFVFPGFILPAIGIYNYVMSLENVKQSEVWPLIFMTLAMAFLLIFIFEFKTLGYKPLIPSVILFAAGSLAFMTIRGIIDKEMWVVFLRWMRNFWPLLLILAGILVIFKNLSFKKAN